MALRRGEPADFDRSDNLTDSHHRMPDYHSKFTILSFSHAEGQEARVMRARDQEFGRAALQRCGRTSVRAIRQGRFVARETGI